MDNFIPHYSGLIANAISQVRWKLVNSCQSYSQKSFGLLFVDTVYSHATSKNSSQVPTAKMFPSKANPGYHDDPPLESRRGRSCYHWPARVTAAAEASRCHQVSQGGNILFDSRSTAIRSRYNHSKTYVTI